MKLLLALLSICVVPQSRAQSGLDRPRLGEMIDRKGLLRSVSGVGGSFLVESPKAKSSLATACAQTLCVAKLTDSILAGGETVPAPSGRAVIAVDAAGAVIYFVETKQFARLQAGALTSIDQNIDGEILSLRSTPAGIDLAVRREDAVWIVSAKGGILDSLPTTTTAALLLADAVVYATSDALVLRRADGTEQRFAARDIRDLFAMGEGWVEARAGADIFALRTDAGHECLYLLPQSAGPTERY